MVSDLSVSIIIPVRNEERYISRCLESVLIQDYPKDTLEVLAVDGMSEDETVQKIRDFLDLSVKGETLPKNNIQETKENILNVRILENREKIVPCGLNIGIREANGKYIIRMVAHTEYANDYVELR